jgi:aryl-alcohol dehydrogenase-like predicted oxidoreductase
MEKNRNNKLSIGSANFGLFYTSDKIKLKKKEIFQILNLAKKNKIYSIDTAQDYKKSEKIIGDYIRTQKIKRWEITTKISNKKLNIAELLKKSNKNLSILPSDLLVHNSNDFLNDKFRNDLIEIKNRKKIRIGVSLYSKDEVYRVLDKYVPDTIQMPINILNKKIYTSGLLKLLKEKKINIQVRSIFLQGLFFKDPNFIKRKFSSIYFPFIKLKDIANSNNLTLSELSLMFINSIKEVNKIIIGINSAKELEKNIKIIKNKISKKIIDEIMDVNEGNIDFLKVLSNWKLK